MDWKLFCIPAEQVVFFLVIITVEISLLLAYIHALIWLASHIPTIRRITDEYQWIHHIEAINRASLGSRVNGHYDENTNQYHGYTFYYGKKEPELVWDETCLKCIAYRASCIGMEGDPFASTRVNSSTSMPVAGMNADQQPQSSTTEESQ